MQPNETLTISEPLACLADVSERAWALLGYGELADGSCFIVDVGSAGEKDGNDKSEPLVRGFFDGSTGDVFPCIDGSFEPHRADGPAVHVIGSINDSTGQVTVRQEHGNYLRICRWDRVDSDSALLKGALLRTLPQCGCGGSLGTPKLFSSFAEMGAYHFCAFFL